MQLVENDWMVKRVAFTERSKSTCSLGKFPTLVKYCPIGQKKITTKLKRLINFWWPSLLTGNTLSRRGVLRIWYILSVAYLLKCWNWQNWLWLTTILSALIIGTLGRPEMTSATGWKTSVDPPALTHSLAPINPLPPMQLLASKPVFSRRFCLFSRPFGSFSAFKEITFAIFVFKRTFLGKF